MIQCGVCGSYMKVVRGTAYYSNVESLLGRLLGCVSSHSSTTAAALKTASLSTQNANCDVTGWLSGRQYTGWMSPRPV